jgi:MipA family protein
MPQKAEPMPWLHFRPARPGWVSATLVAVLAVSAFLPGTAHAQDDPDAPPEGRAQVEGAVGLVARYAPSYPGARDFSWKATPAGFVRWGRYTITGAGGFTTARNEEVERGVGAELLRSKTFQARLGLRLDSGRSESASPSLVGVGSLRSTVRVRLAGRWLLDETPAQTTSVTAAVSTDVLGRGNGSTLELALGRDWRLPDRYRLSLFTGVGAGDARYMQAWHGVTASQSQTSGLPVYAAGAGLRQISLGTQLRRELTPQWSGFVSAGASRLLGSAADSPLTLQRDAWSVQAGLVWRFERR